MLPSSIASSLVSVDDIELVSKGIEFAAEQFTAAVQDLAAAQVDNLRSAVDGLTSAINDNSDLQGPELIAAIQPQVEALDSARQQVDGELNCEGRSAPE